MGPVILGPWVSHQSPAEGVILVGPLIFSPQIPYPNQAALKTGQLTIKFADGKLMWQCNNDQVLWQWGQYKWPHQ